MRQGLDCLFDLVRIQRGRGLDAEAVAELLMAHHVSGMAGMAVHALGIGLSVLRGDGHGLHREFAALEALEAEVDDIRAALAGFDLCGQLEDFRVAQHGEIEPVGTGHGVEQIHGDY